MDNFAKMPPPGLWESIDEELNGPAALRTNWVISGATWLMIAASVCLLAAAGLWLYRYQPFPEVDKIAIIGEKDSISSPRPGVTILNKSRFWDEAKPGADDPEGAVEQAGITTGKTVETGRPGCQQGKSVQPREENKR